MDATEPSRHFQGGAEALLLLGLLLFGAAAAARFATRLRLPSLTGHLLAGLGIGAGAPAMAASSVEFLSMLGQACGGVIIFWIGSQLRFGGRRSRRVWPLAAPALVSVAFCALALGALRPAGAILSPELLVAALALAATSPTVIALVSREDGADDRDARTTTEATVVVNAAIVVLVVLVVAFTADRLPGAGALALVADLVAGLAVGGALALLAARSPHRVTVVSYFATAVCAVVVLREGLVHDGVAVMAGSLFAGVVYATARRPAPDAGEIPRAVARPTEPSSPHAADRPPAPLPIAVGIASAVLFVVTGALVDVETVLAMAAPAAAIVGIRAISLWLGARLAGHIAGDHTVRRLGCATLLPQAGFSFALLAALDVLGTLSAPIISLVSAVAVINALATPPLFRKALSARPKRSSAARPRTRRPWRHPR